ncbi:MAG: hypothetical protein HQL62_09105 [Magnetococcales bacterium]|nr:hypothetical protein [Magnetococcales bacterium]
MDTLCVTETDTGILSAVDGIFDLIGESVDVLKEVYHVNQSMVLAAEELTNNFVGMRTNKKIEAYSCIRSRLTKTKDRLDLLIAKMEDEKHCGISAISIRRMKLALEELDDTLEDYWFVDDPEIRDISAAILAKLDVPCDSVQHSDH